MKFPLWIVCLLLLTSCALVPNRKSDISTQPVSQLTPQSPAPGASSSSSSNTNDEPVGYVQPVDPFEVRIRPKAYSGDLTVISIVAEGSAVKTGDMLLQLDPDQLNRQLAVAKSDLTVAAANVQHVEADAKITSQSEVLALRQQQDAVRQADDAVRWWKTVDGPQSIENEELSLKEFQAAVDDAEDELGELQKMYKGNELTNVTADIVVKRAVRSLDISKQRLAMTQQHFDKFKSFEYPIAEQRPLDGQAEAHLSLQQVQSAQTQSAVVRTAGLVSAHAALDETQRKVNDLQADLDKLTIRAPMDGVVAYGAFVQGTFQGDPKSLRAGERVPPQQVLMTVYDPKKLNVRTDLPEAKFVHIHAGDTATIKPDAFPSELFHAVCEPAVRTPSAGAGAAGYTQILKLDGAAAGLAPGSRLKVIFDAPDQPTSKP